MEKKGLELSINFIIVLVLAIVTLIMGIVIFNIVFRTSVELEKEISQETEDQINKLLMQGDESVILPYFFKHMERGDQHAFGLGIRNYRGTGDFTVNIDFALAVDKENVDKTIEAVGSVDIAKWHFDKIDITIGADALEVVSIPIRVGNKAKSGWVYVFNVNVTDSANNQYGELQKIYVQVR
jgi:hypothetical protein